MLPLNRIQYNVTLLLLTWQKNLSIKGQHHLLIVLIFSPDIVGMELIGTILFYFFY